MDWNLRVASFDGVPFDYIEFPAEGRDARAGVVQTRDSLRRRVQVAEYPFVDGAAVFDRGRRPRPIRMTARFWGTDYLLRWREFEDGPLAAVGARTLVHPIFGTIQAQFISADVLANQRERNHLLVQLQFLESQLAARPFEADEPDDPLQVQVEAEEATASVQNATREVIASVLGDTLSVGIAIAMGDAELDQMWKAGAISGGRVLVETGVQEAIERGEAAEARRTTAVLKRIEGLL